MNHITVSLGELMQAALNDQSPGVIEAIRAIESATICLARQIAERTSVEVGACNYSLENGQGDFLVCFHEAIPGQRMPAILRDIDPASDWAIADRQVVTEAATPTDNIFHRSIYEVEVVSTFSPAPGDASGLPELISQPDVASTTRLVGTESLHPMRAAAILREMGVPRERLGLDDYGNELSPPPQP